MLSTYCVQAVLGADQQIFMKGKQVANSIFVSTVLCLPPLFSGFASLSIILPVEHQGPDMRAGGSMLPQHRTRCCLVCPGLWLSATTGFVTDMFINTATRRGGRTGHSCLSAAVPGPSLQWLQGVMLQNGERSNPVLKGKDCMGAIQQGPDGQES